MFSKSKDAAKLGLPQKIAPPSIISSDLHIVGDLSSNGELHIDGMVDGDIRGKLVLVGETAHIKGEIIADLLTIHGTISGQIKARSVNLAKTAHVTGDILHEDLSIQTGAFLEGHCKRLSPKRDHEGKISLMAGGSGDNDLGKKPGTKLLPAT